MVHPRRWTLILAAAAVLCGLWIGVRAWRTSLLERSFQQGLAAIERGDTAAAAAEIETLMGASGYDGHVHLLRGAVDLRRRRFDDALRHLAQTPHSGNLRSPALSLMGECLYGLGRLEEAAKIFEVQIREQPRDIDARRWLSAISYDLGEIGAAVRQLEELIEIVPEDYRLHRFLGRIHHDDQKQYTAAADRFRRALALDPPRKLRSEIWMELAQSLSAAGRSEAALEAARYADPGVEALALRADCLWRIDDRCAAREALAAAQRLDPNARSVIMLQARWHVDEDDPDSAIGLMQQVLERDPHDFPCRYQLALAYQRAGDESASRDEMVRMQEAKDFRNRLSELYIESRRLDDADVRDEIASLCEQAGKHDMAAAWRVRAQASRRRGPVIELDPRWFQPQATPERSAAL